MWLLTALAALGFARPSTWPSRVQAGKEHTCAVLSDGTLKCFGRNDAGQLGYDHTNSLGDAAGEVAALSAINLGSSSGGSGSSPVSKTAVSVSAGTGFTCALLNDGSVKCWGSGLDGRLGSDGTANIGDESGEMAALGTVNLGTGKTAIAISARDDHACAVLNDHSVKCWGNGENGRLGQDSTDAKGDAVGEMALLQPINLGTGKTALDVSAGFDHTCALLNDGNVKCVGTASQPAPCALGWCASILLPVPSLCRQVLGQRH